MAEGKKNSPRCLTEFERNVVLNRLEANENISLICREYNISRKTVIRWKREKENSIDLETSVESPVRKRQKNLDLKDKVAIIHAIDNGEKLPDLAEIYYVSEMTIRRILKKKEELLKEFTELKHSGAKPNIKNIIKKSQVDEALYSWFKQARSANEVISDAMLKEMGIRYNNELQEIPNFSASNGWLDSFKKRHGIRMVCIHGDKLSANTEAAKSFTTTIDQYLQENKYDLDQTYNADETGLYWKCLPRKSLVAGHERRAAGFKDNKDRVTAMFCANASGCHRIPLLVIGKSQKPRCFKNIKMDNFPVVYVGQKSAWMNQALFIRWYKEVFLEEVKRKHPGTEKPRKVLLLLDNAPSHPKLQELNEIDPTCQVLYLPPNTTSVIQPMDQGVIEKTKKLYRKTLLRELLMRKDAGDALALVKSITLKDCCYYLAAAWKALTDSNLKNAWNKLLKNQDWQDDPTAHIGDVTDLHQMLKKVPGFETTTFDEAKLWIEADAKESGWKVLNPSEILTRIQSGDIYVDNDNVILESDGASTDDEDDENSRSCLEDSVPTLEEAYEGLKLFQLWLESRWDFDRTKHEEVQNLREEVLSFIN